MAEKKRAFILTAGLGTRLRPLTEFVPKPLVPIAGEPLLGHVILNLAASGFDKVALNTHHLPEQVVAYVKDTWKDKVTIFHEAQILDTGGALVNARSFLESSDDFLLHNGDILSDADLGAFFAEHKKRGSLATLLVTNHVPENKVLVSDSVQVIDVAGRRGAATPAGARLATYTGIAALSRDILKLLPASGPSSIIDALIKAIETDPTSVRAWAPQNLYWNDLGTLKTYLKAHDDILVKRTFAPKGLDRASGPVTMGEGSLIAENAHIEGFLALGKNCKIGPGTHLKNCVLLDDAIVTAGQRRADCVIGKDFTVSLASIDLLALKVTQERGFGKAMEAQPLVEQGSDRQFYRLREAAKSEILMLTSPEDPDFDRYVKIGRYLHDNNLGAPIIHATAPHEGSLIMEDLGDDTLYLMVRDEKHEASLAALYEKVIDLLVAMQTKTAKTVTDCPALGDRIFDTNQFLWESSYFADNFLHKDLRTSPQKIHDLSSELRTLAQNAAKQPLVLMHRDFQSQNILIKKGKVRIVDFQGARLGPLTYDLASLLKDAYVHLSAPLRERLLGYYWMRLTKNHGPQINPEMLNHLFLLSGIQRNMQALGAFSFLSLVKGKQKFRQSIPRCLDSLDKGLDELAQADLPPGRLPRLSDLVKQIKEEKTGNLVNR